MSPTVTGAAKGALFGGGTADGPPVVGEARKNDVKNVPVRHPAILGGSPQVSVQWLITRVSFRPLNGVMGPLINGRTSWLINGGDPNYLLSGMILQVFDSLKRNHEMMNQYPQKSYIIHGTGNIKHQLNVGRYTLPGWYGNWIYMP